MRHKPHAAPDSHEVPRMPAYSNYMQSLANLCLPRDVMHACLSCLKTAVPWKGDAAYAPLLVLMLVPTEANSDATTAMAAKLMLGRPRAPANPSPTKHAATPKASASDTVSTVGGAATAVDVTAALAVASTVPMLAASCNVPPAKHSCYAKRMPVTSCV